MIGIPTGANSYGKLVTSDINSNQHTVCNCRCASYKTREVSAGMIDSASVSLLISAVASFIVFRRFLI